MPVRALFLTQNGGDYISSILWDGLQEVLGHDNVSDAGFAPALHKVSAGCDDPCGRISGYRVGRCLRHEDEPYDLFVINVAFLRENDWHRAINLKNRHLKPGGKVVLVDGMDGWDDITMAPFDIHAYFRREIHSKCDYPYRAHSLEFAAPARWLDYNHELPRYYDVFVAHNLGPSPTRWHMLSRIYQTQRQHRSIVCSAGLTGGPDYFGYMRNSKIAVCAPGALGSDCMRYAEVVAAGCVPIFVDLPDKRRAHWFTQEQAFFCRLDDLTATLDRALECDLVQMRRSLLGAVRRYHTTRERAERLLTVAGVTGWQGQ